MHTYRYTCNLCMTYFYNSYGMLMDCIYTHPHHKKKILYTGFALNSTWGKAPMHGRFAPAQCGSYAPIATIQYNLNYGFCLLSLN